MTAIRRHWGFLLFSIISAWGLVRLLDQAMPGHFRVFMSAARAFADGHPAYGTDFGTGVGDYFYSPACALYFFRLFRGLSERAGLITYVVISWSVFVLGARHALSVFGKAARGEGAPPALAQLFWVGVASLVYIAILTSKLELLMAGLLFLLIAWLAERRWLIVAGFLGATITNWKFQPLPVMGLVCLAWLTPASGLPWRMRLRFPLAFVGGLAFWYALPGFELGWARLASDQSIWMTSFSAFVQDSYLNFENIFALVNHAFGVAITYRDTQITTAVVGVALAVNLVAWIRSVHPEPAWPWVMLLSLTSGTLVMTAFSPLGQNNALVLASPLVLAALIRISTSHKPKQLLAIFGVIWLFLAFSYSDLTPIVIRDPLRYLCAKAGACFVLGVVWIALSWRAEWMRMLNERTQTNKILPSRALFCGLLAAFSLMSLTRCGNTHQLSDVSQAQVYPTYNVALDQATSTVTISAAFTQGDGLGPRLRLNSKASIRLADGTLFHEEFSEPDEHTFYQATEGPFSPSQLSKPLVIQFTDASGNEYDNAFAFSGSVDVSTPTSLSISTAMAVPFTPSPALVKGEQIEIRIRQISAVVTHDETPTAASGQATVAVSELATLKPGAAWIRACRILTATPSSHAKVGATATVSSCSAESPITLAQ